MKITYQDLTVEDDKPAMAIEAFEKLVRVFYPEYIKTEFR